ncbi:MAG: hypothetical protein IJ374_03410 [Lachnospiraceae bacterium]|nr:hypothetical protein [Lachnospiraceae bacterium]
MFRMWGKLWKDNHLLKDFVAENSDYSMSRTAMVFQAVEEICQEFDLSQPIWLDANINEFKRHARTRFRKDSFIEAIEFDYLEIHVIEELY